MKFSPETAMYIRDTMKYGGALLVALGYMTGKDATAASSLIELVIPLLEAIGGLILAGFATFWAWKAKRAVSHEAQIIAGRVEANPFTQPIAPPSPLDEKVKDAHL
jgi:hypothetical protein